MATGVRCHGDAARRPVGGEGNSGQSSLPLRDAVLSLIPILFFFLHAFVAALPVVFTCRRLVWLPRPGRRSCCCVVILRSSHHGISRVDPVADARRGTSH